MTIDSTEREIFQCYTAFINNVEANLTFALLETFNCSTPLLRNRLYMATLFVTNTTCQISETKELSKAILLAISCNKLSTMYIAIIPDIIINTFL